MIQKRTLAAMVSLTVLLSISSSVINAGEQEEKSISWGQKIVLWFERHGFDAGYGIQSALFGRSVAYTAQELQSSKETAWYAGAAAALGSSLAHAHLLKLRHTDTFLTALAAYGTATQVVPLRNDTDTSKPADNTARLPTMPTLPKSTIASAVPSTFPLKITFEKGLCVNYFY